jgi:transcriptional regulator with XRE-family HTH domain
MTTKQSIPNSLKFYRKQSGVRQIDVAAKLGFTSYDRISMWENGLSFPSVTNLFRLAALYNVTPHEIYAELFQLIKNNAFVSIETTQP